MSKEALSLSKKNMAVTSGKPSQVAVKEAAAAKEQAAAQEVSSS